MTTTTAAPPETVLIGEKRPFPIFEAMVSGLSLLAMTALLLAPHQIGL